MAIPAPAITETLPESKARGVPQVKVTSIKSRGVVSQPEDRWQTKAADRPFLMEHDILKVTNIDDVDWEFRWDKRRYLVRQGDTGFVPFPAVVIKMGDPRSVPNVVTRFNTDDGQQGVIPTRHDSITTLFAHYGISNEDLAELVDFAPKLEVRTMAEDMIVQFPAQNPDMGSWPVPQAPQPGRENSDTRRMMENMAEDNRALRDEVAQMKAMISERLHPNQMPQGAEPADGGNEPEDPLAAALAGATVDQGPSTQLR